MPGSFFAYAAVLCIQADADAARCSSKNTNISSRNLSNDSDFAQKKRKIN